MEDLTTGINGITAAATELNKRLGNINDPISQMALANCNRFAAIFNRTQSSFIVFQIPYGNDTFVILIVKLGVINQYGFSNNFKKSSFNILCRIYST